MGQANPSSVQLGSAGDSSTEIHRAALSLSSPRPGLSWLDIGCGKGDVLRSIRDEFAPASLAGIDVIDWLADDLRADVKMIVGPAEDAEADPVDRVLMIEVIEHLEAPWSVLRTAAAAVGPGGRIVVTTPSVSNLRHRGELLLRGRLPSFRPDNLPHLSPALPHVIQRVMSEANLRTTIGYCGRDIIPFTRGRLWPNPLHDMAAALTSTSVVVVGEAMPGS